MPYVAIIIVLIFLSIVGIGISKSYAQQKQNQPVTSSRIKDSSRVQIDRMLNNIERKEAPEQKFGAMCYDIAMAPEYQEYVCPIDGEKTVYERSTSTLAELIRNLVEMRRLVAKLNQVTNLAEFSLDETRLCHKHSPNVKDNERFISLVVLYPDKKKHVYHKVNDEDLRMLIGFFEKKLFYATSNEGKTPLKYVLVRIKAMLGIEQ